MNIVKVAADGTEVVIDGRAELARFAERAGLIDPAKSDWMLPILQEGITRGDYWPQIAAALKKAGDPLTTEQKKGFGINPRANVGHLLADSLTAAGAERLNDTAEALATWMDTVSRNALHLHLIATDKVAALFDARDPRTCAVAQEMNGAVFQYGWKLPRLPLPGCDARVCKCGLYRYPQGCPKTASESARSLYKEQIHKWRSRAVYAEHELQRLGYPAGGVGPHQEGRPKSTTPLSEMFVEKKPENADGRKLAAFLIVVIIIILLLSAALGR